ncbi:GPI biosynthesis protein family Pig-F-domain-containing protein [Thamnocephalis sphaerospora]|uniref:GPI biosynthesis protein family Pig-F-domain-containing protein n=1 Tax=Thamnocephalis sphaerospora TaxID=78915 RepID=A0A4P9XQ16_9FUNG|nr:GPI biosynthesis protein family Pig-F-domain-containing protein [Thamnocephalis sphaerospora]|eukprot:RKP08117.1 GPI biosynthesis protein family Pig-F-domain-containing protein [Thamnocephalis sphaerospora]
MATRGRFRQRGDADNLDAYGPVTTRRDTGPTATADVPRLALTLLVQLACIVFVLAGPIGPALLVEPVGRLRIACVLLAGLRALQLYVLPGSAAFKSKRARQRSSVRGYAEVLATAAIATLVGAAILHVTAVFFGAHLTDQFLQTWYGALFVSLVAVTPGVLVFGDRKAEWIRVVLEHQLEHFEDYVIFVPLAASLVGAWAGGIVLPLDWDAWPIPSVLAASGGYVIGSVAVLVMRIFGLGALAQKRAE